jgi:2-polyprenyl-6-methoxyphenol hydroxylase-like FAD-dependent oxidoreductase
MNTTKNESSTDVLVVGAGPTGLVMGAELCRRGINCRVIDTERGTTDKSKAIGIQSRTMELFENMGLADEFIARGLQMKAVNIYDEGKRIIRLPFDELNNSYPFLLMIPQSATEEILLSNLIYHNGEVERQRRLISFTQDASGITAMVAHANGEMETITAKWLIGCDGAHSTVRHQLNIPFEGNEYEDGFQLADVSIDWQLTREEFHLIIHDGWLMAAFPLPGAGNRYRLLLDVPAANAPKDKVPALEELQAVVDKRSHVKAMLSDPKWTANYRIHRRIVSKLREGRVFLAGDAAHIHSPAAAQGMNTGIQDVFNLAWKLALVVNGNAPESLLESYHLERYPVEKGVLKRTDLLLKMVSLKNPLLMGVRDFVAPLLFGFHVVKKRLAEQISELAIEYKNSPVISTLRCQGHFGAGERLPDAIFSRKGTADSASIYSLLRNGKHLLLLLAGEKPDLSELRGLRQTADTVKAFANGQVDLCLISDGDEVENFEGCELLGTEGHAGVYSDSGACVYLVRPDGYIAFCADADQAAEAIIRYLPKIFNKKMTLSPNMSGEAFTHQ